MKQSRREYYRVPDTVVLTYRKATPDSLSIDLEREVAELSDGLGLFLSYASLSTDARYLNGQLRAQMPSAARTCDVLEAKMDILAAIILKREFGDKEHPTHDVNLGGGGIEFVSDEHLAPGTTLLLRIILLPDYRTILAGARVLRDRVVKKQHAIAAEFIYISDCHREQLIKHVLKRDSQQLRARSHLHPSSSST